MTAKIKPNVVDQSPVEKLKGQPAVDRTTSDRNKLVARLLQKHGHIVTLTTKRLVKVRKGQPAVEKESTFQCRIGVSYDNIKKVQEKRESGELPPENAGLNGVEFVHYPTILQSIKSHELYVRCSIVKNNFIPKTTYRFVDSGVEVDRGTVEIIALAAEFPKGERSNDVFNIKLDSIIEMKG